MRVLLYWVDACLMNESLRTKGRRSLRKGRTVNSHSSRSQCIEGIKQTVITRKRERYQLEIQRGKPESILLFESSSFSQRVSSRSKSSFKLSYEVIDNKREYLAIIMYKHAFISPIAPSRRFEEFTTHDFSLSFL